MARANAETTTFDLADLHAALSPAQALAHAIGLAAEGIHGNDGNAILKLATDCEDVITEVKGTIGGLLCKGGGLSLSPEEDPAGMGPMSADLEEGLAEAAQIARTIALAGSAMADGGDHRRHEDDGASIQATAEYLVARLNRLVGLAAELHPEREDDPSPPAAGKTMIGGEEVGDVDIESEVIDVVRSVALASDVLDEILDYGNSEKMGPMHRYLLSRGQIENVLFTLTVARRAAAELESKYYGQAHGAVRPQPRTEEGRPQALAS